MNIHQFELDTIVDENNDCSSDPHYFFRDKDSLLSSWRAQRKADKLLIIAYQELKRGLMEIVDIKELLTFPESVQITSLGTLLLNTKKGVLQLFLESRCIRLDATQATYPMIDPWKEENQQFPGMAITDQVSIRAKKLTRYTTTSRGFYGDPFLEESILCLLSKSNSEEGNAYATPLILVGNSRFDSQLKLIHCCQYSLFKIPILNFAMNHTHLSENIQLIGWNKCQMQAIQIKCRDDITAPIQVTDESTREFKDIAIMERSTLYRDHPSRFVVLSDRERPYRFFCLETE